MNQPLYHSYRNLCLLLLILIFTTGIGHPISPTKDLAVSSPQAYEDSLWAFCVMNGNNISTLVYNYGSIGHHIDNPSWGWPQNKKTRYGNEFGFILGAEVPDDFSDDDPNDLVHVMTQSMKDSRGTADQGWSPQPCWHNPDAPTTHQQGTLATYNRPEVWGNCFPKAKDGVSLLWPGQFGDGVRVADFECFYKMDDRHHLIPYYAFDPEDGRLGLGVEVTVRGYQFSPKILADMIFFQYEMKNVSRITMNENERGKKLEKLVVGIMGDPLIEGLDDASDDMVEARPEDDLVFYWDADNTVFADIGYMGFHFLETPKAADGTMLNLTSYSAVLVSRLAPWDISGMWEALTPGHAEIRQKVDNLLLMGSGYFELPVDSTQKLTFLCAFALTKEQLLEQVVIADKVYWNNFIYLMAPETPVVTATAGDASVTLEWDHHAEQSTDPLFGNDFEGYLVYRSTDGVHWGKPIAQFDKNDGVKGYHNVPIDDSLFYIGDDTGLEYEFTDSNLVNGLSYYFAVTAYDTGSVRNGVPPLECAKFIGSSNVVKVTPNTTPARTLDEIAAVPNPYIAASLLDAPAHPNAMGTYSGRRVMFINLPQKCTIRIYTVTGELVQTIAHDAESGDESWDLLNYDGLGVASGTYLYHVDAPGVGEKIGRLSIIK